MFFFCFFFLLSLQKVTGCTTAWLLNRNSTTCKKTLAVKLDSNWCQHIMNGKQKKKKNQKKNRKRQKTKRKKSHTNLLECQFSERSCENRPLPLLRSPSPTVCSGLQISLGKPSGWDTNTTLPESHYRCSTLSKPNVRTHSCVLK